MQGPAELIPGCFLFSSAAFAGADACLGELTSAAALVSSETLAGAEARLGAALAVLERVCRPPEPRAFSMGNAALACAQKWQQ